MQRKRFPHHLARTFGLAGLLIATGAPAFAQTAGALTVTDTWSRATPGGAKVAGGYVTIANTGPAADRLTSVTSAIAGRGEVHEMAVKDGVMTMREMAGGIAIPAGGSVTLKPGGLHLMFQELKQPLREGEKFEATLVFEKAGPVKATFDVRSIAAGASTGGSHGSGMKMNH